MFIKGVDNSTKFAVWVAPKGNANVKFTIEKKAINSIFYQTEQLRVFDSDKFAEHKLKDQAGLQSKARFQVNP